MKIECKLQRQGGTHVTIDGAAYHFAPGADGAHVAEVENDAHVDRFLSIAEAYRLYREPKAAEPQAMPADDSAPAAPQDATEPKKTRKK